MSKEIWVIEVDLASVDLFNYRVRELGNMLKTNVVRVFSKVNELSTKWKESDWIAVGVAHSEDEANQKAEHLKTMAISEKEHALATGESLYLNL